MSLSPEHRLTLASKSKSRATVLRAAGLSFEQISSGVDEDALKDSLRAEGASVAKQADLLAETKALKVSISQPGIVLGCDQMLDLDGVGLDKVSTREAAAEVLRSLRGKTHILQSAIVADGAEGRHCGFPHERFFVFGAQLDEFLDDLIGDDLVLTAPLTPDTRGIIGAAELAMLPQGAHVVNVGRGELVDEPALVAALQAGHLGGAALDVFVVEPLPDASPLWDLPNVIVTPHSAGTTPLSAMRAAEIFADNLLRFTEGRPLRNVGP